MPGVLGKLQFWPRHRNDHLEDSYGPPRDSPFTGSKNIKEITTFMGDCYLFCLFTSVTLILPAFLGGR